MSYRNLQAGDVVQFLLPPRPGNTAHESHGIIIDGRESRTAAVLRYLTFPTHVVVHYGHFGHVVNDSNFVRVVRSARGSVPHSKREQFSCPVMQARYERA